MIEREFSEENPLGGTADRHDIEGEKDLVGKYNFQADPKKTCRYCGQLSINHRRCRRCTILIHDKDAVLKPFKGMDGVRESDFSPALCQECFDKIYGRRI